MSLLATQYEFTRKGFVFIVSKSKDTSWSVIRYPEFSFRIPPLGDVLTDHGWIRATRCIDGFVAKYFKSAEAIYELITAPTEDELTEGERQSNLYENVTKQMDAAICSAANTNGVSVIYSAYEVDENDIPINNLDKVVAEGTFTVCYDGGWGDPYRNPVRVKDPTYLDLAIYADTAIKMSGDDHHVFFEGANVNHVGGEIDLFFGS